MADVKRGLVLQGAVAAVLLAVSWLVYGPARQAPFLLDDRAAIEGNTAIRSLWPLWEVLDPPAAGVSFSRRPVANLTMALNYAVGDVAVEGYRVANLVLHALNAWLLWLLVPRMLARTAHPPPAATTRWAGLAAALLWVAHPLSTSAVQYLTQRPEMLVALFFLLMVLAQLRALDSPRPGWWLAAAAAACLAGMGSKESMVLAPVLAVLLDHCATRWPWRGQVRRRWGYYLLLLATVAWPLWRVAVNRDDAILGTDWTGRWHYFLTVTEGVARHTWLLVWPRDLVFDYGTQTVNAGMAVWPSLLAAGVAAALVLWGLGRRSLAAWTGAAAFAMLLPSWINMVPGQPVAEHRFYLPAGLLLGLAAGAGARWTAGRAGRGWFLSAVVLLAVLAAGWAAQDRAAMYLRPLELMQADITRWPRSDRGYFNLALTQEYEGDFAAAAANYQRAMAASPFTNWRLMIAAARMQLRQGRTDEATALAAEAFNQVLATTGAPDLLLFAGNMVSSFRSTGHLALALPMLEQAVTHPEHGPRFEELLREVKAEVQGHGSVVEELRAASPGNPVLTMNLAISLAKDGRREEALQVLEELLASMPQGTRPAKAAEVWALKGGLLDQDQHPAEAADALRRALAHNPSHAEALNNLAWLLATTPDPTLHKPAEAVDLARKACRLGPNNTWFLGTLAVALAAAGDETGSAEAARKADHAAKMAGMERPDLTEALRRARERAQAR